MAVLISALGIFLQKTERPILASTLTEFSSRELAKVSLGRNSVSRWTGLPSQFSSNLYDTTKRASQSNHDAPHPLFLVSRNTITMLCLHVYDLKDDNSIKADSKTVFVSSFKNDGVRAVPVSVQRR